MSVWRDRAALWAVLLLAGTGLVYVALLAFVLPLNGLWAGDQGAKLAQILSLIANRFRSGALVYPGAALDPEGALSPLPALFTTLRGSEWYSIYSYPYAALSAALFFVLGYPGLYVIPVLATLGSAALTAAIGRRLGLARWWLLIPLAGLASPLGFYALVLWEHALATCLALAAALCALIALDRERPRFALVAGLLGGLAYWMRAELLWLAPALLAGLLWAGARRNLLLWAAVGFAALIGCALIANLLFFGQPLGPQVAVNYQLATGGLPSRLLANITVMALDEPGPLLALVGLACAIAAAALPRWRPWLLGALALTSALAIGLFPEEPHTGLAVACPLALAGLGALRLRGRPEVRLLLGAALAYALGVLLSAPNQGGAQWGPRYLLPAIALALPPAALVLAQMSGEGRRDAPGSREADGAAPRAPASRQARWAIRAMVGLLLAASALGFGMGVGTLRSSTRNSLRLIQVVNAQPDPVVVTDTWIGPQLLAPLLLERQIFYVDTPAMIARAREALARNGVGRFGYLTARPWERDTTMPPELGLDCIRVEGFAYGLTLLDCTIIADS